ncbi:response regulator transcription factor [Sphingomonas glacialis]|uniref:DNA-binding response regulator n=1 Tax=Sphingomonas glacialis TaxID=658225 RepID=A0A502FWL4_9SPHN|nr:response regulator [Sphingomonas glacialis]TPG54027.1 DNA-binding response regulator [Sphingomonas glacialis]
MSDKRIIHLVDDEEAIRRSAGFLLRNAGFEVCAYASGTEFLGAVGGTEPGCILLDIRMPGLDGLEVQRILVERSIAYPIIVLTGHGDITLSVRAIKAGAIDFLEKPFEKAALLHAIDEAFERLEAAFAQQLDASEASMRLAALTPRERDVLDGLVAGQPNKITAYKLGISTRTVETHRANLTHKLGVRSMSDVLRLAFAADPGPLTGA